MDVKFLDGLDILIPNQDRFLVLHTSLLLRLNIPRTEGPFNNKKTCGPYSQHDMRRPRNFKLAFNCSVLLALTPDCLTSKAYHCCVRLKILISVKSL